MSTAEATRSVHALLLEACAVLHFAQRDLAECTQVSVRTVQRWMAGAAPSPLQLARLAVKVHPADPKLAAELAAAANQTLESLGLAKREPDPAAARPAEIEPAHRALLLDGCISAAADALDLPPKAVRAAILAALERALRAGITAADLQQAAGGTPTR